MKKRAWAGWALVCGTGLAVLGCSAEGMEGPSTEGDAPRDDGHAYAPDNGETEGEVATRQEALVKPGFLAVWQSGSGAQYWRSGMYGAAAFKKYDDQKFAEGFRIKSVDVYDYSESCGLGCTRRAYQYTAVWEPGSGAQYWRAGMSGASLVDYTNTYHTQGLRIAALAVSSDGKYTAVWRPGTAAARIVTAMSSSALNSKSSELWSQGFNMTQLVTYDGKYTAYWQSLGKNEVRESWGKSYSSIASDDSHWFNRGLRLVSLDVRSDKYSAIWHSGMGNGAQWWFSGLTPTDMVEKDKDYFKNGLRIRTLRVRKYEYADPTPTRNTDTGGGTNGQMPTTCSPYTAVAEATQCYNLDGTSSQYYSPGSMTGIGYGCSLSDAQTQAVRSLTTALGACVTTSPSAGCCTYRFR